MISLLPLRTILTFLVLVLAFIIFMWSRSYAPFFIGLWASCVMTARIGTQYFEWATRGFGWEITLTLGSIFMLLALWMLAFNIYNQKRVRE